MALTAIENGASVGAGRGDVVIVIPLFGGHDLFVACLRSVVAHTAADVPILICDDDSPDRRSEQFVRELAGSGCPNALFYLRQSENLGFPGNCNAGFAAAAPADVVILNSDCEVGGGWLEGLVAAGASDSTVATVTTLTNYGTIVSAPAPVPSHLPQELTIERAAAAVAANSQRLYPRLPTAIGHCVLIRRAALDLVGDFDLAFSPGYGEEVDLSQRALQAGMCHILADDVYVLHHGGGSFSANLERSAIQDAHEAIINTRYPYYPAAVAAATERGGQLTQAVLAARRALRGMEVLIDARPLGGATTGTQIHIAELLTALHRTGGVQVVALVPDRLSEYAAEALGRYPEIQRITRHEAEVHGYQADVVHRPYQVNYLDDLTLLRKLGRRVVITHQDLIGFHNPAYFPDYDRWEGYRKITELGLASADAVLFFSDHARSQALAENLLEPTRSRVIHIGVDHTLSGSHPAPTMPGEAAGLGPDRDLVVCIGTDFRHKNRTFALRVVAELQRRHGWDGRLALVGPAVDFGSSRGQEAEALALNPQLASAVIELPAVTEAEKTWLYQRAALVLYPTVHEGFGLVPFEAAEYGRACLWADGTSLTEVLPGIDGGIVPWDAAATADAAMALLGDPALRAANVAAIQAAAASHTWDATAAELVRSYGEISASPPNPAANAGLGSSVGFMGFSEDLINLMTSIPEDVERPLLALATHQQISLPVFGSLRFAYRAGYALKRVITGARAS